MGKKERKEEEDSYTHMVCVYIYISGEERVYFALPGNIPSLRESYVCVCVEIEPKTKKSEKQLHRLQPCHSFAVTWP